MVTASHWHTNQATKQQTKLQTSNCSLDHQRTTSSPSWAGEILCETTSASPPDLRCHGATAPNLDPPLVPRPTRPTRPPCTVQQVQCPLPLAHLFTGADGRVESNDVHLQRRLTGSTGRWCWGSAQRTSGYTLGVTKLRGNYPQLK